MSTTGEQAFTLCMAIIDEFTLNGTVDASSTADYRSKSPTILTLLVTELAGMEQVESDFITDLAQPLVLSDRTSRLILPYGLAAHLLLDENPDVASFCNQRYEELKRTIPQSFQPITDVYGVTTCNEGW